MKRGDWIRINFTGRVKATGEVFDVSREADAKKYGIYDKEDKSKKYGPSLVILGSGSMMPGVERELLEMKVDEKKSFDVSPRDGAGQRKPELIRVLPLSKFLEKNMSPFPGLWVNIDNRNCKVIAVSGGRVRVDFNHPLAGKELSYDVEVTEEIRDRRERIRALLDYYGLEGRVETDGKKNVVTLEKDNPFMKRLIEETLKKWGGVDSESLEFRAKGEPKATGKDMRTGQSKRKPERRALKA
jgi:FKBP-type peptidyl-prolyl cis-trans isomerase 2